MGIQNDAILCYGIEFEYEDIVILKESKQFKELVEEIGCDDIPNLWQEMSFITASNYYDQDEEYYNYIIGVEIKDNLSLSDFISQFDKEEIKNYIKDECKKYNLTYIEPKIICRPNIF
jgi:hypothetical protein